VKTAQAFGRLPAQLRVAALLSVVEEQTAQGSGGGAGHQRDGSEAARVSRATAAEERSGKAGNEAMSRHDEERMKQTLRAALPRVEAECRIWASSA